MSESRILVHTSIQPMRWGDMDPLGHVNNTVYFRYMEQARIEWLYQLTASQGGAYGNDSGPVIVNASCTFLEPLVYPGDVHVRMLLGEPGRSSVGSFYELQCNGRTHAEGAAKIVWIGMASRRAVPLPAAITAQFAAVAGASPAATAPG